MWLLAQSELGDRAFEIFGAFAFIVIGLGWFSYIMIRRLIAQNDKLQEQRDEMIHTLASVVPLVKESTEVLKTIEPLTKDVVEALREARWVLDRRKES